jgi:hypothetical protein
MSRERRFSTSALTIWWRIRLLVGLGGTGIRSNFNRYVELLMVSPFHTGLLGDGSLDAINAADISWLGRKLYRVGRSPMDWIVFDLVGLVEHLRNPLLAISEMRCPAVAGEMAMVCQRSEAAGQRSFNDAKYEIQCLRIDCSSAELSSYAGEISGNAVSTSIRTNPRIRDSALLLDTSVHRLL